MLAKTQLSWSDFTCDYRAGKLEVSCWHTTQKWALLQGWPVDCKDWEGAFIEQMLSSEHAYRLAMIDSGVVILICE